MPETKEDVVVNDGAYKESDDFVPDPTHQFGTVDTSGTAGTAHARIEEVTPVFDVAKKQDAIVAARALDPDDDGVDSSMVVLPTGVHIAGEDPEAAIKRVQEAGKAAAKDKVSLDPTKTKAQDEAKEEGDEAEAKADASQKQQGAGSRTGSSTRRPAADK